MKTIIILIALTSQAAAGWECRDVRAAIKLAGGVDAAVHIARVSGASEADINTARQCLRRHRVTSKRDQASTTLDQR